MTARRQTVQNKRETPAGSLSLRGVPQSWDEQTREIDLVISTGAPGTRWDWRTGQNYIEELDVAGCNLERLQNAGPVLLDHDAEVESLIGTVLEARVEGGAVIARVKLSGRAEMAGYVKDIADGVIRSISVGYSVEEEEILKEEGQLERRIARKWTLWEVSFVAMPFDTGAKVRSAEQPHARQGENMSTKTETPAPAVQTPVIDAAAIRAAEADRQTKVRASAAKLQIDAATVDAVLRETETYEAAAAKLLEAAATREAQTPTVPTHRAGHSAYGDTRQDAVMRGVVDALSLRAGLQVDKASPVNEVVRERTLPGLMRQMLEAGGVNTAGMTTARMLEVSMRMARQAESEMLTRGGDVASHTISDFPTALSYLGRKIMMAAYQAEPLLFDQFSQRRDLTNLRAEKLLRIGAFPTPVETPEAGSVVYGTISDRGETYQAAKYTSGFAITEEALINDDIGMLVDVLRQMGSAAVGVQKKLFFGLFTANTSTGPTMSDGNTWFSAAHANKGTAGALSVDNVGELTNMLLSQPAEGQSDQYIYNEPRFLLVPSHYKNAADKIVTPNFIGSTSAAPDSILSLKVLAEPRLGTGGNKPWYVVGQNSGLYHGYLGDVPGPRMRQIVDQETLSVKLVLDLFFACQVGDWKGVAQNPYGL